MNSYYTKMRPAVPAANEDAADSSSVQADSNSSADVRYGAGGNILSGWDSASDRLGTRRFVYMPAGLTESNGELDLGMLTDWMRSHPGGIPRQVQHKIGHQAFDLSSAIKLVINDHLFWLFLSSDESLALLRICLIQKETFILMKERGMEKHGPREGPGLGLDIGDVAWKGWQIESLTSVGTLPSEHASPFYTIFWHWWLKK